LNMACKSHAAHNVYKRKHSGFSPVVLSAKRMEGMRSRALQEDKLQQLAALEEEQRYKQYLRDGNEALTKCFTNMQQLEERDDDELQEARDKLLAVKVKDQKAHVLLEQYRKERIMRANHILYLLKPGPRALHQALLTSEAVHQQKYHDALNKEIAEDAQRQQRHDEQQCPTVIIPFGHVTEEEAKAKEKEKALNYRESYKQDLEEKRLRLLAERNQAISDGLIEREQCRLLNEKADKEAKEQSERKREFCRRAYREALQEKAAIAKSDQIREAIDDRINCVVQVARRNLQTEHKNQVEKMRSGQLRDRQTGALRIWQLQQAKKRQMDSSVAETEERYDAEVQMDEARRQCEIEVLAKQRRAYQLEEKKLAHEKRLKEAEVRRFNMATRFRNVRCNKEFSQAEKAYKDKVAANLRRVLLGQRQQFLEQQQEEMMRIPPCIEDPNLDDDVNFFQGAVDFMQDSEKQGRPLYPMVKAVEQYKRESQVDMTPEGQMERRNTQRDSCWPGFLSKAEQAFRNYEHREKCRKEMEQKRHSIFNNCIKINRMAQAENPFKPCTSGEIIRCMRDYEIPVCETRGSL
ncbi:hypothetical protein KR222_001089, partial [Zaprionus bogoriensis]